MIGGTAGVQQVADESGTITLVRAYKPFGGILQWQYETAFSGAPCGRRPGSPTTSTAAPSHPSPWTTPTASPPGSGGGATWIGAAGRGCTTW